MTSPGDYQKESGEKLSKICETLENACRQLSSVETKLSRRRSCGEEPLNKVKALRGSARAAISLFVELKKTVIDLEKCGGLLTKIEPLGQNNCAYVCSRTVVTQSTIHQVVFDFISERMLKCCCCFHNHTSIPKGCQLSPNAEALPCVPAIEIHPTASD